MLQMPFQGYQKTKISPHPRRLALSVLDEQDQSINAGYATAPKCLTLTSVSFLTQNTIKNCYPTVEKVALGMQIDWNFFEIGGK